MTEGPYHLWIPCPVPHPLWSVLILTKVIPFCLALPVPPLPFDEPVVVLLIWPQTPARPIATPKSSPTALAIATPLSPMAIPNATPPIPMASPIATHLSHMAIPITMPLSYAATSLTSTPPAKNGFTDSHASCQNGFTDSHASRHSSFTDIYATHHKSFIDSRASPYTSFNNSHASMPPYGNTRQYCSIPLQCSTNSHGSSHQCDLIAYHSSFLIPDSSSNIHGRGRTHHTQDPLSNIHGHSQTLSSPNNPAQVPLSYYSSSAILEATGAAATHNPTPASARDPCGLTKAQASQHSQTSCCSTSQHQTSDANSVHKVHSVNPPPSAPVQSISIPFKAPSTPVSTNSVPLTSTKHQTTAGSNPPSVSSPSSSSSSSSTSSSS